VNFDLLIPHYTYFHHHRHQHKIILILQPQNPKTPKPQRRIERIFNFSKFHYLLSS
jgi:hypothetical protein